MAFILEAQTEGRGDATLILAISGLWRRWDNIDTREIRRFDTHEQAERERAHRQLRIGLSRKLVVVEE